MCYQLVLSTDAAVDLTAHNDRLLAFSRDLPDLRATQRLAYPHRWFVGSRSGCSCGFRHLTAESVALGFGAPVTWFPEEAEDLAATLGFVRVVQLLLATGAHVDCIDVWLSGEWTGKDIGETTVDLTVIEADAFRFFENHRFEFSGLGAMDDATGSRP